MADAQTAQSIGSKVACGVPGATAVSAAVWGDTLIPAESVRSGAERDAPRRIAASGNGAAKLDDRLAIDPVDFEEADDVCEASLESFPARDPPPGSCAELGNLLHFLACGEKRVIQSPADCFG